MGMIFSGHRKEIEYLSEITAFSPEAMESLFADFYKTFPGGIVTPENLSCALKKYFPFGNPYLFCSHFFRLVDSTSDENISPDDFFLAADRLVNGSASTKKKFIFRFYDVDCDGKLSHTDIETALRSIYELFGTAKHIQADLISANMHALFEKYSSADGYISLDGFMLISSTSTLNGEKFNTREP